MLVEQSADCYRSGEDARGVSAGGYHAEVISLRANFSTDSRARPSRN
jgi:hypothetical protein